MMDAVVVARALCAADDVDPEAVVYGIPSGGVTLDVITTEAAMRRAKADVVIAALAKEGYVVVPREPTEYMLTNDGTWAEALAEDAAGVWREMIRAALGERA